MDATPFLERKAVELAEDVVRMTTEAGSGHPSSALSLTHLVTVLMYDQMRFDPKNPADRTSDRLILSEGHAVPVVYAAWADLGGTVMWRGRRKALTREDLLSLREADSPLDGHPNPHVGFPFFDLATGSLGQGLSGACGLALAARLDGLDRRFFVIIGDGESREGQIWEALDFLIDYDLTNVIPIFNCNGLGQSDPVSPQEAAEKLQAKLEAFGLDARILDGHDAGLLRRELGDARDAKRPTALLLKTVKGWGVQELQDGHHHGKALKPAQLEPALRNLRDRLPEIAHDTPEVILQAPRPDPRIKPKEFARPTRLPNPDFSMLLDGDPGLEAYRQGKVSTRRAYGLALRELARRDERIVALDGDVKNSTYSDYMQRALPERFFESRIAEQNMISVAAGLAAAGRIPFVSSFAKFLIRGYDQFELALIAGLPLKLVGSHAGCSTGADGPSQMGLSDLAFMRCYANVRDAERPLVTVFHPSDAVAAWKCVQTMADLPGACYLRTVRADLPLLYAPTETFEPGGYKILRRGHDAALLSCGYMTHVCLDLAEALVEDGLDVAVFDCYSLPLHYKAVTDAAAMAQGRLLTVEDSYGGGLGAEVADMITRHPLRHAVLDQMNVRAMPASGRSGEDVLERVGLGRDEIAHRIRGSARRHQSAHI